MVIILILAFLFGADAQKIVEIYNKLTIYNETTGLPVKNFELINFKYSEMVSKIHNFDTFLERRKPQCHRYILLCL